MLFRQNSEKKPVFRSYFFSASCPESVEGVAAFGSEFVEGVTTFGSEGVSVCGAGFSKSSISLNLIKEKLLSVSVVISPTRPTLLPKNSVRLASAIAPVASA